MVNFTKPSNSGYAGTTCIKFYVERVKDPKNGTLRPSPKDESYESIVRNGLELVELELEIQGRSYYRPGRYTGAYEDSYPDEGDTEIEAIKLDGQTWDGKLTLSEIERAECELDFAVKSVDLRFDEDAFDYGDYDDYDECDT